MTEPALLDFHQCTQCDAIDSACIDLCATCLSHDMIIVQVPGHGRLVSWTTIRKPPLQFKAEGIYHVGVFDLDNGSRVTGRFQPQDGDEIGDRVIAVTQTVQEKSNITFKVEKYV